MTLSYALGFLGAALMLASYMMKSMLPLRLVALAACVCLALYGWIAAAMPTLLLYGLLVPINAKKAWQVRQLVKAIERAKHDTPVAEWLLPHMTRRVAKAGELLWSKGDIATEMVYVETGMLRLVEHKELLGPGTLVGEIGLLAADNKRTLSVRSETDCVLFTMSAEQMAQLYYQNPTLGFHVMRLVVARLQHDADKARAIADAAKLAAATS
ncbi:MAG TPA: cyclic nucleotide-binding domain-containing protein [Burkholderiaceae bacterium]|nr:cyclic nucleotide-binding domain-containing protein [Burkholderiaceae bacterium]